MGILKTLSRRFFPLRLNLQTIPHRPTASIPQPQLGPIPQTRPNKKPLHALFSQAVGLSEKLATPDDEDNDTESESNAILRKNLIELEKEIKSLKDKKKVVPKRSLFAVFTNQPPDTVAPHKVKEVKPREPVVVKRLSNDAVMFMQYLYEKGYFRDANFVQGKRSFDLAWFDNHFARGYVKCAAQKFARDNKEIAKWLSGSALKQVAMFGCPSIDRSGVVPAKKLRKFFEVPEDTVCSKCSLRQSCKFANQSVPKSNTNNLDLEVVMKVITLYALEFVHPQLVVPDEVNNSVSKLLEEVVKLSQTT